MVFQRSPCQASPKGASNQQQRTKRDAGVRCPFRKDAVFWGSCCRVSPRGRQISSSERNAMPAGAAHLEKMQYSGVVVVECPPRGCQISSSERNEVPAGAVRPIYVQFYQKPAMNICLQFCVMCAIINKIELPRPQAQIDFSTSGGVFLCPEPAISRKQF